MYSLEETLAITIQKGTNKVHKKIHVKLILGFIGGAMISLGYLAYVRVVASVVTQWGGFATLIGAAIFPVGLIAILLGGGELITGNMMVVSAAWFAKKVSTKELLLNFLTITLANIVGALSVAYFFGHIVGLTSTGDYLQLTLAAASAKIDASFWQAFISGIGCNWFVGLSVWLCYGTKDTVGKYLGIWFPVTTFVAIGFQHSVANVFIIAAAIFENGPTWTDFILNFIPVYLGNIVGGAVMVAGLYYLSFEKNN